MDQSSRHPRPAPVAVGWVSPLPVWVDGVRFGAAGAPRLDLSVSSGETLALVGPRGAGKTTILRLLLGVLRPTSGVVRVFGGRATDPGIRRRIGYLPARIAVDPRYTLRDLLDFYAILHGSHHPAWVAVLIDRFDIDPGVRVGRLNPPGRLAVGIMTAVAHRPELLILDEPTAPLPPPSRAVLWQLVAELNAAGSTVIAAARSIDRMRTVADRVAVVDGGRLVAVHQVRPAPGQPPASALLDAG